VPPSAATLAPGVVTCSSVSKAHGAPGLRLGWLTCTDPALLGRLREAKFQTTISCSRVDEFLAARVLSRAAEILAPRAAFLERSLAELARWAEKQQVAMVTPDGGPMCCLRLQAEVDVAAFHRRLAARETRVAPGAWFGIAIAATYLGVGEGARAAVARWALDRRPGDGKSAVADVPSVQLRLGRADADLRAARIVVLDVARRWDEAMASGDAAGLAAAAETCRSPSWSALARP